jgi:orotate phosphoribosyltransferase
MNCGQLADKLRDLAWDSVISPALGGIIVGQEIGRSLGKRHIFAREGSRRPRPAPRICDFA